MVEHEEGKMGEFYLMQGVQRRVIVILSHESGEDLKWERVIDMTIGMQLCVCVCVCVCVRVFMYVCVMMRIIDLRPSRLSFFFLFLLSGQVSLSPKPDANPSPAISLSILPSLIKQTTGDDRQETK